MIWYRFVCIYIYSNFQYDWKTFFAYYFIFFGKPLESVQKVIFFLLYIFGILIIWKFLYFCHFSHDNLLWTMLNAFFCILLTLLIHTCNSFLITVYCLLEFWIHSLSKNMKNVYENYFNQGCNVQCIEQLLMNISFMNIES